jgi:uncharacterized protein (DUF1499 family)
MLWVLAGVAIVTIFIFSHVDDWSRDLTTNTAWTDEASQTLKPLRVAKSPELVKADLLRVVDSMSNWRVADGGEDGGVADGGSLKVHLVRTTTIMRFKDDIWVTLMPGDSEGSTVVQVRSQSRLGRGDLGQNPRNIRELLGRLAQVP